MKTGLHKIFFVLLMLCTFNTLLQAQQADSSARDKTKIRFKLGAFVNSRLNLYGRTDSLKSSGFYPSAEIWLGDHFYVSASPVFVNNPVNSFEYAGTIATAGLQFYKQDQYIIGITATRPIYKSGIALPQSALKGQLSGSYSWLNKIINVNLGADLKFSDKTDYGLNGGLDHLIRNEWKDGSVFVIDPSAYVYAGTQQFTKTYLSKTPGVLIFPGTTQTVSEDVKNFNVLAYEFSVPMVYSKGGWQLIVNPAYIIPQNLITVEGRPDITERGKEMFYITAGVKYSF